MPLSKRQIIRLSLVVCLIFFVIRLVETQLQARKIVEVITHQTYADVVVNSSNCLKQFAIPLTYCSPRPTPVEDTGIGDIGQVLLVNLWTNFTNIPATKFGLTTFNIWFTAFSFLLLAFLLWRSGQAWSAVVLVFFAGYWLRREHFGVDYRSLALAVFNLGLISILLWYECLARWKKRLAHLGLERLLFLAFLLLAFITTALTTMLRQPIGLAALFATSVMIFRSIDWQKFRSLIRALLLVTLLTSSYYVKDAFCMLRDRIYHFQSNGYLPAHGTGHTMLVGLGVETLNPWGLRSTFSDGDFQTIGMRLGTDSYYTQEGQSLFQKIYLKIAISEPLEFFFVIWQKFKATALMNIQFLNPLSYLLLIFGLGLVGRRRQTLFEPKVRPWILSLWIYVLLNGFGQGLLAASEYAYVAEVGYLLLATLYLERVFDKNTQPVRKMGVPLQRWMTVALGGVGLVIVTVFILQMKFTQPEDQAIAAAAQGDIELFKDRLAELKVANMDVRDFLEYTPLMKAAARGNVKMMKYLIEQGSDVNADNLFQVTALMQALWYGQTEAVEFLLASGADIHKKSVGEYGAVCFASRHPQLKQRLIQLGAEDNTYYCSVRTTNYKKILR